MSGPFRPAELAGADEPLDAAVLAEALATARELEAAAIAADARPSAGFSERVLAAVAAEPLPRPMAALGWAARHGRLGALMAALADTWRLAWSGGRPLAVRAQALAVVIVLVVAAGAMSGLAVVGVAGLLRQPSVTLPSPEEVPGLLPSPTASPEPTATPEPTTSPEPPATPRRSTPRPTVQPTETPEATDDSGSDDHSGGDDGAGSGGSSGESDAEGSGLDDPDGEG